VPDAIARSSPEVVASGIVRARPGLRSSRDAGSLAAGASFGFARDGLALAEGLAAPPDAGRADRRVALDLAAGATDPIVSTDAPSGSRIPRSGSADMSSTSLAMDDRPAPVRTAATE
jgi:hypothetical protein